MNTLRRYGKTTAATVVVALSTLALPNGAATAQAGAPQQCAPGGPAVTFSGTATSADVKTYRDLPFEVMAGTTRIEMTYGWSDPPLAIPGSVNANVFDLGLWDADDGGAGAAVAFRGWSGSRAGRVANGQPPIFVQQDVAQRGYQPAPINPGIWTADLGIAAIDPVTGTSDWNVSVTCSNPAVGAPFVADPVDPTAVANPAAGWYAGDFHMHGVNSNRRAPSWQDMVNYAQMMGLDFMPITDYVTGVHWDQLGPIQRANPNMLLLPGREVITYYGHANTIGETRSVLEYRHGHNGVTLGDIQSLAVAAGALFQMNHPTFFPGPLFANFCRGCEFQIENDIDLDQVTNFEVLTGPAEVSSEELGVPDSGLLGPNPFVATAIQEWEQLLLQGHRITAVSGSDSKGVEGSDLQTPDRRMWGTSATQVYAQSLSRPAIFAAMRAGHAYVQTLGTLRSPTVSFTAAGPGGATYIMGDTVPVLSAPMTANVQGGDGQLLVISADGVPIGAAIPITSNDFTYTWTANSLPTAGPLGTFWRFDVVDATEPSLRTIITNPIFLRSSLTQPNPSTTTPAGPTTTGAPTGATSPPGTDSAAPSPNVAPNTQRLAQTGGSPVALPLAGVALCLALLAQIRRRYWLR